MVCTPVKAFHGALEPLSNDCELLAYHCGSGDGLYTLGRAHGGLSVQFERLDLLHQPNGFQDGFLRRLAVLAAVRSSLTVSSCLPSLA